MTACVSSAMHTLTHADARTCFFVHLPLVQVEWLVNEFRTTRKSLLLANPALLSAASHVEAGAAVCILPDICTQVHVCVCVSHFPSSVCMYSTSATCSVVALDVREMCGVVLACVLKNFRHNQPGPPPPFLPLPSHSKARSLS
jgi:hypothetical protein